MMAGDVEASVAPQLPAGIKLRHRPRNGWRRERKTSAVPFRYIGKIAAWSEAGDVNEGTGVMVGPRHVLTAGHVVKPFAGWRSDTILFMPGRDGTDTPLGAVMVRRVRYFPGFRALRRLPGGELDWSTAEFTTDLALLLLSRTTEEDTPTADIGHWGEPRRAGDSRGSTIGGVDSWRAGGFRANVAGYPKEKGFQLWHAYDDTLSLGGDASQLFLRHRLASGHSGSPVWVTRSASAGGRALAAIFVGWRFLDSRHAQGCARRVDRSVRDFIADNRI